jgi:hypothetical protein
MGARMETKKYLAPVRPKHRAPEIDPNDTVKPRRDLHTKTPNQ